MKKFLIFILFCFISCSSSTISTPSRSLTLSSRRAEYKVFDSVKSVKLVCDTFKNGVIVDEKFFFIKFSGDGDKKEKRWGAVEWRREGKNFLINLTCNNGRKPELLQINY